jgi:CRP/FNR family transcriptional regulator, cyclic AMP receptor protein
VYASVSEADMGLFDYPTGTTTAGSVHAAPPFTLLADLPEGFWKTILAIVNTLHFRKGDCIISEGEHDNAFFILSSGSVEVVTLNRRGRETVIVEIPQGSVFGEIAFFVGGPRTATVRAREDGVAIRVTRENLEHLAAWEPQIARRILFDLGHVLAIRLRSTTEQLSKHAL